MVLDISRVAVGIMLDVCPPVKVRVHDDETRRVRLVKKRPTERVSRGEHEQTTRTKHTPNLAQERRRVRDERDRPAGREGEVKRPIGKRKPLSVSLHHRQHRPGRTVEVLRVQELPLRQVDADRVSALTNKPTPALASAAANLDNPSPRDIAQQV